jgi:1-aminocyclopropane-1-carboxylate deaminase/D-cysteine desulfhydrase-like pyridoxal-dependent ACC family enzyme
MLQNINNLCLPSPLQQLRLTDINNKEINLYIKREDLIHPWVSGNKYRKLKYNLQEALKTNNQPVITFGGAFSNHLHAAAGVCYLLGIPSIGIIRGEIDHSNPTLTFCREHGMQLIPVSRSAYKLKEQSEEVHEILKSYPDATIIPEGGTNESALPGVSEIIDELALQMELMPDYIVLACGTGGTTAGLLASDKLNSQIIAVSVLKSYNQHKDILSLAGNKNADKLNVITDYHFGGYARWNDLLINFINDFEHKTNIPLDHVYNAKAMFALVDLIKSGFFTNGSTICYIHTGGLQGKKGLGYRLQ